MQNKTEIYQAFFDALDTGNINTINTLIKEKKIDVNTEIGDMRPLTHAAYHEQAGIAQTLIVHGADVNMPNNHMGSAPLVAAIQAGNPEIVKILLEHDSDISFQNHYNNESLDTLTLALKSPNTKIIKMLLERYVDVTALNNSNQLIPWELIQALDNTIIPSLLEKGLDSNKISNNNSVILSLEQAVKLGYSDALTELLHNNQIRSNLESSSLNKMLHAAVHYNQLDICENLLEYGEYGNDILINTTNLLSRAIMKEHTQMVDMLLNRNISISELPIKETLESSNLEIIKLFLEKGANAQELIEDHNIPWKLLSILDHENTIMPSLTEQGLTQATIDMSHPASLKCAISHASIDEIKMLLDNVDMQTLNTADPIGQVMMYYYVRCQTSVSTQYECRTQIKGILKILMEHGFDSQNISWDFKLSVELNDPEMMQIFLNKSRHVNNKLSGNNTYLMCAAEYGSLDALEALLKHDMTAGLNLTPLPKDTLEISSDEAQEIIQNLTIHYMKSSNLLLQTAHSNTSLARQGKYASEVLSYMTNSQKTLEEALNEFPETKNKLQFIKRFEDTKKDITEKLVHLIPDINDILPPRTQVDSTEVQALAESMGRQRI